MREMVEYCNRGTRGRGTPRVMVKKWISAPDVVNDDVNENIDVGESLPDYLARDMKNDNTPGFLERMNLFSSPAAAHNEFVLPAGDENIATEYDLVKEALLSNPIDFTGMYATSDKNKHLNYVSNNDLKSSEINLTTDRDLNQIHARNRRENYENDKNLLANAELSAGWLQTKLAHIDSLDKVTDWLRALGAPGFKLNEKHKISHKIKEKGGQ